MIKTLSYFCAEFERAFVDAEQNEPLFEKRVVHIPAKPKEMDENTDIEAYYKKDIIEYLKKKIDDVMIEGSGFTLSKIEHLRVQILKYEPLRGSGGEVKLPSGLKNKKKSILNLKNTDKECFKWCILAALHHDKVYKRKRNDANSYREWNDELKFNGIEFPVQIHQIEKFMDQNKNIAVNVYFYDDAQKRICPLFLALKSNIHSFVVAHQSM